MITLEKVGKNNSLFARADIFLIAHLLLQFINSPRVLLYCKKYTGKELTWINISEKQVGNHFSFIKLLAALKHTLPENQAKKKKTQKAKK